MVSYLTIKVLVVNMTGAIKTLEKATSTIA
jgi:hypothetical protein